MASRRVKIRRFKNVVIKKINPIVGKMINQHINIIKKYFNSDIEFNRKINIIRIIIKNDSNEIFDILWKQFKNLTVGDFDINKVISDIENNTATFKEAQEIFKFIIPSDDIQFKKTDMDNIREIIKISSEDIKKIIDILNVFKNRISKI